MDGILIKGMTCRKAGGVTTPGVPQRWQITHSGRWGLGFEAAQVGDVARNVGQWKIVLGLERQAEEHCLDPEGLDKRKDRARSGY